MDATKREEIAEKVEDIETTEGEEELEEGELKEGEEWQKEETEEGTEDSEDSEEDKPKPEKALKAKKKLKGLLSERETELTEQQKENERLRLENEELKARSLKNDPGKQLKRPLKDDFEDEYGDVDLDKYREALDAYDDQRYEQRQAAKRAEQDEQVVKESISESVNSHYYRAEKLVETSGISPEKYKSADTNFRKVFKNLSPDKGDAVADRIISTLGEGSEKTVYFIGNNETQREKAATLIRQDPTGLKLMAYLGAENARLRGLTTGKPKTKAPAPAANANGDISIIQGTAKDSRLKKQYDAAHKKKDDDAAWEIRKSARAAGIDVSSW